MPNLHRKIIRPQVTNVAALKLIDISNYDTGIDSAVMTGAASSGVTLYVYHKTSAAVADDDLIVAPAVGSGRWIKVAAQENAIELWDRVTGGVDYIKLHYPTDHVGATAVRIPKGWFTDLEITNAPTVSGAAVYYSGGIDVALADGGLNASLTASNGGIFYSTAAAGAILAGTATANQALLSGASAAPAWSTAKYPATTTINQLLYSNVANTIVGLTTGNDSILITSAAGVPSLATDIPTAVTIGAKYIYRADGADVPIADGGTNSSAALVNGRMMVSSGDAIVEGTPTVSGGSIGAVTDITVDFLKLDGNTLSSTSGNILIIPLAGQLVILDSNWAFDGNTLSANTNNDLIITAFAGNNITIESVTFDGGVVGGVTTLSMSSTFTNSSLNVANGILRSSDAGVISSSTSVDVDNLTLTNIETDNFKVNVVDTDGTLAANSDTRFSSQKAIKTFVNNSLAGLSWRTAVDLHDSTQTNAGANIVGQASYNADSIAITNGDRLLLTAETTAPGTYLDRVFLVGGVGVAITLTLETDGQAGDGSPTDGDTLFIQRGTANGDKSLTYDGSDWVLGASLNGALLATNNLSDVNNTTTSFNAISPVTTLGDIIYRDASNNARLAGNVTVTKKFLSQTGGGAVSAAPVWDDINVSDLSGTLPIANGGTNSNAALVSGFMMVSAGGAIVEGTPTVSGGSIGAVTDITVDFLKLDGNTLSSTSGNILIIPLAGQLVILDSNWAFDGNTLSANTNNDLIITAFAGNNITIESVTFDGGVVGGVTTLSMSSQLTNTLAIGTPPFVITSTTVIPNLNVDMCDGYHFNQALLTTSSPSYAGLTVVHPSSETNLYIDTNTNNAGESDLVFRKSRASGVITTGDRIGQHTYRGHDGTGYVTAATMRTVAIGTIATNQIPGQLEFYAANSTGALTHLLNLNATQAKFKQNIEIERGHATVDIDATSGDPSLRLIENGTAAWALSYSTAGNYFYIRDTVNSRDLMRLQDDGNAVFQSGAGNVGIGTTTFNGTAIKYLAIANGTQPAAHTDNQVYIGAKDSSDAKSTLAFYTEQDVEIIGTFTASHKKKIWMEGVEYWIQLDAV